MDPSLPWVSVVIVSHNRPHTLEESLGCLGRQTHVPLETLVVDNLSPTSEAIARVVRSHERAAGTFNIRNIGFGAAMNIGMRAAKGEYVLFLADDILLDSRCVENLVRAFASEPRPGLVTGTLYRGKSSAIQCIGGRVELGAIYRQELIGAGQTDRGQYQDPFDVSYVPGGFAMAERVWLADIGGFREDFHLYFEDTELGLRVVRHGRKLVAVPAAKAFDAEARHEYDADRVEADKIRNFFSVYWIHARRGVLPEFFFRYGLLGFVRACRSGPRHAAAFLRGTWGFFLRIRQLWRER